MKKNHKAVKRTYRRAPQMPDFSLKQLKPWLIVSITIIVIALIMMLFNSGEVKSGQAIMINDAPILVEPVDLTIHHTMTIVALPEESRTINISAGLDPYDQSPKNYTFTLTRIKSDLYKIIIKNADETLILAEDILDLASGADSTIIHLNTEDGSPDLRVSYENRNIVVQTLQYLSAAQAKIVLLNSTGVPYPRVILWDNSLALNGILNANSTSPPLLSVNLGTLSGIVTDDRQNYTQVNYTYTLPTTVTTAQLLDITARVSDLESHSYYNLVVNNSVYELNETLYPRQRLTLVDPRSGKAYLEITFRRTTNLQPLSFPCLLENDDISNLFTSSTAVKYVYAYDSRTAAAKIWANGAPSELTKFSPWNGYFVKLATADQDVTVSTYCYIEELLPVSTVPPMESILSRASAQSALLSGWNLISVPGTIPLPLTHLISGTVDDLTVYQCSENYNCEVYDGPLNPGKSYWISALTPKLMNYNLTAR